MERKKLFVRVGIGVAGALLLVGIFAVANAVGDSNAMRRGIDEGFELRGAYQGDPGRDGIGTIAFQTLDGEPSWEASKAPGAHVKGAFKEAVDPNVYVLEDESRQRGRLGPSCVLRCPGGGSAVRPLRRGRPGGDAQGG